MVYSPLLLDEITWGNNKIKLQYTTDRLDKYKDRLNNISISTGSSIVKSIVFDNNSYWGTRETNYRMKLDSVEIKGENNFSAGEKYKFKYNENNLPDYVNFNKLENIGCSEDYWGYYNGIDFQNFFIPREYCDIDNNFKANRNPSEYPMQSCILKEIEYPAGGSTEFEYEANRVYGAYDYLQGEAIVGGLRIKSIISKTDGGEIRKSYEYSGHANQMIKRDMFQYEQQKIYTFLFPMLMPQPETYYATWRVNISNPLYSITGWSGSPVFYETVTEYAGNFSENTGKKVYKYMKSTRDIALSYPDHLIGPDLYRFWSPYYNYDQGLLSPILTSEEIFEFSDNKYTLRKGIYHYYNLRDKGKITCGVRIGFRDIWINVDNFSPGVSYFPYDSNEDFINKNMAFYDIEAYRCFYLLDKTQTIEYSTNGNITGQIDYIYDPEYRSLFPTEKQISKSDGTNYKEVLTYPFNINITPYTEMVQNNIINPVINKTKQVNTFESVSIQNNYRKDGSIFVIDNIQTGNNGMLEPRITYHNYDSQGNPLYVSKDDADKIVYLWGYNYQYPVAEIRNIVYAQVRSVLGDDLINRVAQAYTPSGSDLATINTTLRALSNVQVTTYTYKPLVGIETVTDSRGVISYYVYDSFGRLKETYYYEENDPNKKRVIETYDYHYRN